MHNKVQTNDHGVTVLVETEHSTNRHHSPLNRRVKNIRVLSDDEIIERWRKRMENDELILAKAWIKRMQCFAISNCEDTKLKLKYNDIVQFAYDISDLDD